MYNIIFREKISHHTTNDGLTLNREIYLLVIYNMLSYNILCTSCDRSGFRRRPNIDPNIHRGILRWRKRSRLMYQPMSDKYFTIPHWHGESYFSKHKTTKTANICDDAAYFIPTGIYYSRCEKVYIIIWKTITFFCCCCFIEMFAQYLHIIMIQLAIHYLQFTIINNI